MKRLITIMLIITLSVTSTLFCTTGFADEVEDTYDDEIFGYNENLMPRPSFYTLPNSNGYTDGTCELRPPLNPIINATPTVKYTITGLSSVNPIQNFFVGASYIYVSQLIKFYPNKNNKEIFHYDVRISRCTINGSTATFRDYMTLKKFGHNQTLELYSHNGEVYMLVGCKENLEFEDHLFTMQIGRVKYVANTTITSYTQIPRLARLDCANENGTPFDTTSPGNNVIKRVDACLSSDKTSMAIATRSVNGKIQYSYFNTEIINDLFDEVENQSPCYVNCYHNTDIMDDCYFSCVQVGDDRILPNKGCQGLDMSNAGSLYISGGVGADDTGDDNIADVIYTPKVGKMTINSNDDGYNYRKCVAMTTITNGVPPEIEGVKIISDKICFILDTPFQDYRTTTKKIYQINKSLFS